MRVLPFIVVPLVWLVFGCAPSTHPRITAPETPVMPRYAPTGNEPVVAVFSFDNVSLYGAEALGPSTAEMFQTVLVQSRRVRVVDRENLDRIMQEYRLGLSGVTGTDVSHLGEQYGVGYIITGKVTECGIRTTGGSLAVGTVNAATFSGAGGGMGIQRGTARLVVDIKITELATGMIIYMTSAVGEAYSESMKTMAGLMQSGVIAGVSSGGGVQGFDQTIEGMAARAAAINALNTMVREGVFPTME